MYLLDDLNNKELPIDRMLELLLKAKANGDTTVKVTTGLIGYESYISIETAAPEVKGESYSSDWEHGCIFLHWNPKTKEVHWDGNQEAIKHARIPQCPECGSRAVVCPDCENRKPPMYIIGPEGVSSV